jgi:hypothetical protein
VAALPAEVLELRKQLEQRFPHAQPVVRGTVAGVATGVAELDGALPSGGLPRGRVTLWQPGGGATAVLRSACRLVVGSGERAVWVDGTGMVGLSPGVGEVGDLREGFLLFRPGPSFSAWCAEELLRCGGFGLVVLVGGGWGEVEGVRLGRAVREGGSAFVAVAESMPVSHLRVCSGFDPSGFRWRWGPFGEPTLLESVVVRARLQSMGLDRRVRFRLPVEHQDVRLSLEPRLVDRRGAGR